MKKITLLLAFTTLIISTSCSLQKGYVKLNNNIPVEDPVGIEVIRKFIKQNPKASIVVTAPNSKEKSTQSDPNSNIYNVIEKELLRAGFDVKDRGLYNEVVSKSKEINYVELKKLTGTDVILELVKVNTDVPYKTNKWYKKDGKEMIYEDGEFTLKGTSIEFKFTLIEGNKYAGSYTFNSVPCTEKTNDCRCEVAYKNIPSKIYPWLSFCRGNYSKESRQGYEYGGTEFLNEFVKSRVVDMIQSIRN